MDAQPLERSSQPAEGHQPPVLGDTQPLDPPNAESEGSAGFAAYPHTHAATVDLANSDISKMERENDRGSVGQSADDYTGAIFSIKDEGSSITPIDDSDDDVREQPDSQEGKVRLEAQKQLASPNAWLSDNTINLLQSVIWTQAKAASSNLEETVVLDPLYVQIDSDAFATAMPKLFSRHLKARWILVPLHHHSPRHWTLAIIQPAYRQIFWYDSLRNSARAERTEPRLRRWAAFAIPGDQPFQFFRLVSFPPNSSSPSLLPSAAAIVAFEQV